VLGFVLAFGLKDITLVAVANVAVLIGNPYFQVLSNTYIRFSLTVSLFRPFLKRSFDLNVIIRT